MKNTIKYFYNIETENICQSHNRYIFNAKNNIYSFENCSDYFSSIDEIYRLNQYMIYNNIPVYSIILNKFNDVITYINDVPYLLLLIDDKYDKIITISDILLYQYSANSDFKTNLKANNWKKMWSNKIDYIEYQVNQFGLNYPLIRESMGYFVGISENAICMLNEIKEENNNLFFQHRRIRYNSLRYDFLSPLNIIFDTRVRDLTEFYKSKFIENEQNDIDIIDCIRKLNVNDVELLLFYIRMFFPTFYFDRYETIILNRENEQKIKKIINKIDEYELLLNELSSIVSQYIYIPNIEWIIKKRKTNLRL